MITFITGENNIGLEKYAKSIFDYFQEHIEVFYNKDLDKIELLPLYEIELHHNILLLYPEFKHSPRKQSLIGRCLVEHKEINIVVVSHSDHIWYSLRVCMNQGLILPEELKSLFITDKVEEIKLNKYGRIINDCPDGFFDQYEIHLDNLL